MHIPTVPTAARLALTRILALALVILGVSAPVMASSILVVQPVQICTDAGTACGTMTFDLSTVQAIWAQAGLTIDFLPARTFNSTTFQTMDSKQEIDSFLVAFPSPDPAAPAGFLSSPINVWFSLATSSLVANGIIGGNRSWVASNLTSEVQSLFLAKALGLNLGLPLIFNDDSGNLMSAVGQIGQTFLTADQIDTVLSSHFVTDTPTVVPEPATAMLLLSGLVGLGCRRRKRL